jgi:alkanesulfonate monooxygenase SsuD/methylene tetrahydromethanopterin reductase-like flavin-dependent oxidoreductase (luciferase family)
MSRGRLQLGLGRGAVWPEQELYGVDPASIAERYAEARDIVLLALSSAQVSFSGKHFNFKDFPMLLRPYQQPRPPLWYGIGNPDSAVWAAANDVNVISLQPAAVARRTLDRYREEWALLGKSEADLPFLGLSRQVVVAATDREAEQIARAAYPRWRASFARIWEQRGLPLPRPLPQEWDALQANGMCIAGAPRTVSDYLAEQRQLAHSNFFVCQMVFGTMEREAALRSLTLFAEQVAPALAA